MRIRVSICGIVVICLRLFVAMFEERVKSSVSDNKQKRIAQTNKNQNRFIILGAKMPQAIVLGMILRRGFP